MRHPCLLLLPLLFFACGPETDAPEAKSAPPLSEALLGTWEHTELDVTIHSVDALADSTYELSIREADWARVYGMYPSRTTFTPDGKLVRLHRLRNEPGDNIVHGLWREDGDSLRIIEPNTTLDFGYDLQEDRLVLNGRIDHDRDGSKDDEYRAVYRLVSRTGN